MSRPVSRRKFLKLFTLGTLGAVASVSGLLYWKRWQLHAELLRDFRQSHETISLALQKNPSAKQWYDRLHVRSVERQPVETARIQLHSFRSRLDEIDRSRIVFKQRRRKQVFEDVVNAFAPAYGIDPKLVLAIMRVESGYHHQDVSETGARGLMQILRSTDRFIKQQGMRKIVPTSSNAAEPLFDALYNIDGGIAYLDYLKKLARQEGFGTEQDHIKTALLAYNQGFRGVRADEKRTQLALDYFTKIAKEYEELQR